MRSLFFVTPLVLGLLSAQTPSPEARARQFLELLSNKDGDGAAGMLDPQFKAMLPPEKLQQVWSSINAQAGAFRQFAETRVETGSVTDTVYITCEFEKMKLDARIPVTKAGMISGMNFGLHTEYSPPAYVNTAFFHERELIVGRGEWAVHGTLTIPNGPGPFPAVALVHGSGSYDRDYTIGPNKLFRDIGWGLASRGVAVLRYNKRSFEHATQFGRLAVYTVNEEAVDDAVLAAALLREQPEINPKKVFVLGHSLGATVAPRIGKADPSLAGLIMAGALGRFMLDVIVPQMVHNYELNGEMTPAQQKAVDTMKAQIARAEDPNLKPDAPAKDMPLGAAASYWLDLRAYHQLEVARALKMPMLILQGERDYQVTMEDFDLWKKALGDRKDVEFKVYPKLSHIFVEGEGPSSDAEYARPGHVSGAVIEDIAAYIKIKK
ncbi:MAG TPA: alpha/beta fold hydrolase [Verrucomicrobiae bacterium]|nr:alpha/beta fold hydrolase [Verrucomicrobiae bacterium]